MSEVIETLKAKGRELLVLLTAIAMLLSAALGLIGDATLILIVGAVGWFLSEKKTDEKK